MLGYKSAKKVIELGRGAFFDYSEADLPRGRSDQLQIDDHTPQFGFVGSRYTDTRILLLGINPGNGRRNDRRTPGDSRMMPAIIAFAREPTEANFEKASKAYKAECQQWRTWRQHCAEVMGAGKLSFEEIAYSNCLPWRTGSESNFNKKTAEKAAVLYVLPLLMELNPTVLIAMGKKSQTIISTVDFPIPSMVTWNRARAATDNVKRQRSESAAEILKLIRR